MTEIETSETSLTIRRTFDALRERKWRASTDDQPTSTGERPT